MAVRDVSIGEGEKLGVPTSFPDARPVAQIETEGLFVPEHNEYNALAEAPIRNNQNEYETIIADDKQGQAIALKQAMFVAQAEDPERKAKVLELSKSMNLPAAIVDRNYDSLVNKVEPVKDYDSFIKTSPKLSQWLADPDNATLAKDDLQNLQGVEKTVNDFSMLKSSYYALNVGASNLMKQLAEVPSFLVDLSNLPINYGLQFSGSDKRIQSPDWLRFQFATEHWQKQAEAWKTPEMDLSITHELSEGNYASAGRALFTQFVANAPVQAAIIASTIGGAGIPAVIGAGVLQGADVNERGKTTETGQAAGTNAITTNALVQGTVEAAFERLGTFGILKSWEHQIVKMAGKDGAVQVMKDFAKTFMYSIAGEGNEEFWTSAAQDLSDYITDVNPDALTGILQRAADAGLVGAASGGVMTGPAGAHTSISRMSDIKQAQMAKDFYLSFGKSAEATKLRERLPIKQKEFVESLTKGTDVENIYVPVQAMETYFQDQKINPTHAMQEIGILKEFNEAKETGTDVKIPMSTWAENVVGTPVYEGLANDVKFDPGALTFSEQKAADVQAKEEMAKLADQKSEESVAKIRESVKSQLIEAGTLPADANKQVSLYESAFRSLGERTGQDPLKLFQQYALRIGKPELAATVTQNEQVLNQSQTQQGVEVQHTPSFYENAKKVIQEKSGNFITPSEIHSFVSDVPQEQKSALKLDEFIRGRKRIPKAEVLNFVQKQQAISSKEAALKEGTSLFQGGKEGPRGQIRFGNNRQFNIDLLKKADMSTFLHETGHFYLEVLGDVALSEKATDQIKGDYQTILDWLGVKSKEEIKKEQHEKFARGFEAYLMEGKAPSSALQKAFQHFKVWLTNIYRQVTNLKVDLNPEIRKVFDRLLATEDEIASAEVKQNMNPLFSDPIASGMSEAQAKRYIQARDDARAASEQSLQDKILEEVRREKTKEYKEKRSTVKTGVEAAVNNQNLYKAIEILRGEVQLLGSDEVKLSKEEVIKQYGKEFVKKLPRGIFAKEGGLHSDIVAELLQFESGDSMLTQMANAPDKKAAIEQLTNQKMKDLYPELLTSDALQNEAMKSIHNEKRSLLLRMELEHLASNNLPVLKDVIRKVAKRVPSEKAVREQSARIIGSKSIEQIRPYIYERAEAKAAKQAGELLAKGDISGAFEAKRIELLNHELYRAAITANEQMDKAIKDYKNINRKDEDLAGLRDMNLVNAARALLAQYGLGKQDQPASTYLEQLKRYDPEIYDTVQVLVGPVSEAAKSYKDLTYDQFLDLRNSVQALWELSRSEKQIEIDGVKMDRDLAIQELSTKFPESKKDFTKYTKAATKWEKTKMTMLGMISALRRVESWVDTMDSGNIAGSFRKFLFNPVSESIAQYRAAQAVEIKKFLSLIEPIKQDLIPKPIVAQELGHEFSGKSELLGALLHTGNESNFSKLLRGNGWGAVDSEGNLDKSRWNSFMNRMWIEGVLTKKDYDFVQAVWDQLESIKPLAQKAHKAMYGYYFNEITAQEFETPFGIYRGGYVPAVADALKSPDQNIRNEKELLEKFNNSFMFPTTGRGFTKKRVDAYAAPLVMDLRLIPGHLDKVLRFSYIEPSVKQVSRIVMNNSFRKTLDAFDPTVGSDMLVPWLQRSAQQKIETPSQGWGWRGLDTVFKEVRKRTGLNIMAVNVVNTLQNYTGFSLAAVKVKPRFLKSSLWNYIKAPNQTAQDIAEKSSFMQTRTATQVFEIQKSIDEILLNPSRYDKAIEFAKEHGYFLQKVTQNQLDLITWQAAYDQAVEEGHSEKDAVRSGDSAVRLTQGSFNPEDVSRFETGSPVLRAFTMFYSYFNMQANLLGSEFTKTIRQMGLRKGAGRALYIYTLGFMVPAVLSEAIVRMMSGKPDDDDDGSYLDDILSTFFQGQFRTATAMFPIIGPTVQAGVNQFNNKWYDDRISTSPSVSALERSVAAPVSVYKAISENGSKKKAIQDSLTLLGLITGAPVAPLSRPLGYLSDVSEGNAQPSGPFDFARGLVTGRPGK